MAHDLVKWGLYPIIGEATQQEMLEIWMDERNKQGFEYSVKANDENEIRRDKIFFFKKF